MDKILFVTKVLIFHSDRGSHYTANAFRKLLPYCVIQSFSHSGRPHGNAVAEAFFSLLKREKIYRRNYQSNRDFKVSNARYMNIYNSNLSHRNNNYKSPEQFEQDYMSCCPNKLSTVYQIFLFRFEIYSISDSLS